MFLDVSQSESCVSITCQPLIGCYDYDVVFVAGVKIKLELRSFSVLLQELL